MLRYTFLTSVLTPVFKEGYSQDIRRILFVKRTTNLSALYGETGRMLLNVTRKVNMLKYWLHILKQDPNSLIRQVFIMLKEDFDLNRTYSRKNWAFQIKSIHDSHEFSYIWEYQFEIDIPFDEIKNRMFDTYKQTLFGEINNSGGLQSYLLFKHELHLEKYLSSITEKKYRLENIST